MPVSRCRWPGCSRNASSSLPASPASPPATVLAAGKDLTPGPPRTEDGPELGRQRGIAPFERLQLLERLNERDPASQQELRDELGGQPLQHAGHALFRDGCTVRASEEFAGNKVKTH
jgi:hypothetical protein